MIAQIQEFKPALAVIESDSSPEVEENVFDDLAFLSQQIDELLRLKERGDDYAHSLALVQRAVKGMAVEFGMVREVLKNQDDLLKSQGLKVQLIPVS